VQIQRDPHRLFEGDFSHAAILPDTRLHSAVDAVRSL
jgi:hypothetical protein